VSIDFQTLQDLSNGAAQIDVACPLCGPGCKTPVNRNRKTLRIYNSEPGFSTYVCARCGEKGFAHDGGSRRSGNKQDPIQDIIDAFKAPTNVVPFKEPDTGNTDLARALWRRSLPARGTIVETYLRNRCCWLDTETVHFLPARGDHPPAMIVPFGMPTEPEPGLLDITSASVHGVQLTKLKPDGSGKAALEPNKITIGRCIGYPIVLTPPNDLGSLFIVEGVESALTVALLTGSGTWASGGASRLPAIAERVPSHIEKVTIVSEDDNAGREGSNELARRIYARGIEVKLCTISDDGVAA
jgi:hypothetical protein